MKKILLSLLFSGVLMVNAGAQNLDWKEAAGEVFYQANVYAVKGIAVKTELNGVQISAAKGNGVTTTSSLPQYFLEKGENELKIYINDYIKTDDQHFETDAIFEVNIHAVEKDGYPSEDNKAASYQINQLSSSEVPNVVTLKFNVENAPPSGRVVPIMVSEITQADKDNIKLLTKEVLSAIKTNDHEKLYKVMKYSYESTDAKFYREFSEQQGLEKARKSMRMYKKLANADFDFNDFALDSIGGKYFIALNGGGDMFLTVKNPSSGRSSGVSLAFSKASNGAWYISSTTLRPSTQPSISAEIKNKLSI